MVSTPSRSAYCRDLNSRAHFLQRMLSKKLLEKPAVIMMLRVNCLQPELFVSGRLWRKRRPPVWLHQTSWLFRWNSAQDNFTGRWWWSLHNYIFSCSYVWGAYTASDKGMHCAEIRAYFTRLYTLYACMHECKKARPSWKHQLMFASSLSLYMPYRGQRIQSLHAVISY